LARYHSANATRQSLENPQILQNFVAGHYHQGGKAKEEQRESYASFDHRTSPLVANQMKNLIFKIPTVTTLLKKHEIRATIRMSEKQRAQAAAVAQTRLNRA
jgi:hypothetical protein